ncbi:MAG TPA: type III pantothenate kinase [Planctomycetaceae bacterium]|nr:type III pantothenate kinase [Planctomycetaceae bacterium]
MAQRLTLAIDVGNSRIKFGVLHRNPSAASNSALPAILASLAAPIEGDLDWRAVTAHFATWQPSIARVAIAGVNPAGVEKIIAGWPHDVWPAPRVLRGAADLLLRVNLESPDRVGIDRLLDAVAANLLRKPDQPVIVIDSGTATTVDLVSGSGAFEGGAILPGLQLGARALHQFTALLPLIDLAALEAGAVAPLGRDTDAAIRSGLWFGQIGAVRELVARLAESAGRPPLLLVTGGDGRSLAGALGPPFRFEPDLALCGLAWLVESGGS